MKYNFNTSSKNQIKEHLTECSKLFVPRLDSYIEIEKYSEKIFDKANRIEFLCQDKLKGLIAYYVNGQEAFITNVSVTQDYIGKEIASELMEQCFLRLIKQGIREVLLDVKRDNSRAIKFYKKHNFFIKEEKNNNFTMKKNLLRDYDSESRDTSDHKYVYNFDFDIMHHYMIESFREYIVSGSILELGSFEGEFTKRLIPFSKNITCVEASKDAVEIAKKKLGEDIIIYNTLFEDFESKIKYDNIILTHVLEHIDDRISLLNKIKQEWVSENGKIFIVCPNANALSRQIAKEMGIIKNVTDITDSEKKHGHTITYTLEKLEEEVESAGLKIKYKGGIFLKALANFQWDEVISKNIVNKDYLDGCFQMGKKYPDLCSSIIIVCEK